MACKQEAFTNFMDPCQERNKAFRQYRFSAERFPKSHQRGEMTLVNLLLMLRTSRKKQFIGLQVQ